MFYRILSALFEPELADLAFLDTESAVDRAYMRNRIVEHVRSAVPVVLPEDKRIVERRVESVLEEHNYDPFCLLAALSRFFVSERDGFPVFRYWDSPQYSPTGTWKALTAGPQKIGLWRDLSLHMDLTPLSAMTFADHNLALDHPAVVCENDITMSDLEVDRILDQGLAETHLHLSAAFSFRCFVRELLDPSSGFPNIVADRAIKRTENIPGLPYRTANLLGCVAVVRELLLNWEQYVREVDENELPDHGIQKDVIKLREQLLFCVRESADRRNRITADDDVRKLESIERLNGIIAEMDIPNMKNYAEQRFKDRRNIAENRGWELPRDYEAIVNNDTAFLTKLFKQYWGLGRERFNREKFCFVWFYLQLKNAMYRIVVQEKGFPGFAEFRKHFQRMIVLKTSDAASIVDVTGDPRLKVVEVRISPDYGDLGEFCVKIQNILEEQQSIILQEYRECPARNTCGALAEADDSGNSVCPFYSNNDRPSVFIRKKRRSMLNLRRDCKLGIVAHMTKPDSDLRREPNEETGALRYQTNFDALHQQAVSYLRQAMYVDRLIQFVPDISAYLVGLDVANVETAVPNYMFFSPLSLVREAWAQSGEFRKSDRQTMGLTYHAGEDFYDIVSALRTMDVVIERFNMKAGDRIGHGFAAGVDVAWWCSRHNPSAVTLEDEVFDRLWEWHLFRDGTLAPTDFPRREIELQELASEWLDRREVNLSALMTMYRLLHEGFHARLMEDEAAIVEIGASRAAQEQNRQQQRLGAELHKAVSQFDRSNNKISEAYIHLNELMERYFHDSGVFERGQRRLRHVVHDTGAVCRIEAMQRYVCKKIADRGITVEGNLSSNYVILHLDKLADHPIYRWCTPEGDLNCGFPVSVNTDNPAIFNTSVSTEFALLFFGALERGMSRKEALGLVETLRRNNLTSTFVRRRFQSLEDELNHLCRTINRLQNISEYMA